MKWREAIDQLRRERELAMQAKHVRDRAMRDLRDKMHKESLERLKKEHEQHDR